ncbi:hypothetical protein Pst134EA_030679 [Puccinia striiformis f. sp. tritici]|uniref:hypothetical protein n=1 Tax=Puccinia striiformis f. sp. tritici TaxID=168172 RepID=UPI002007387D|nr:hypothetical protein Pst134EA_030679 [Puccinia striiformis f. sp. tritici]KAH9446774.1 hypothetical protein Pst134EA_030679 [Puccinia striiformis f. sp. tritici]
MFNNIMTRGFPMALLLIIALSSGFSLGAPTPGSIVMPGKGGACEGSCAAQGAPSAGRGCTSADECRK